MTRPTVNLKLAEKAQMWASNGAKLFRELCGHVLGFLRGGESGDTFQGKSNMWSQSFYETADAHERSAGVGG